MYLAALAGASGQRVEGFLGMAAQQPMDVRVTVYLVDPEPSGLHFLPDLPVR